MKLLFVIYWVRERGEELERKKECIWDEDGKRGL